MRPVALLLALLAAAPAAAATHTYVIAIGNNAAPLASPGGRDAQSGDDELRALKYADDDAAAFYEFAAPLASAATLLTVLDRESQERYPELAAIARAPSLFELRQAIARLREQLADDRKQGHDPVLLFFFSGHGRRGGTRAPALALVDGDLTQDVLYDEVLSLPTRYTHVIVDACHAEAVVRPRDASAAAVDIADDDVRRYVARATLQRFPHVGALVATTSGAQAHEWDAWQRGVFSHELLSGLRGAADVDGNGRIEYSELYAFLRAANRDVSDPRARLEVVARPPALDRRAPIVDLHGQPRVAQLVGRGSYLGAFHIEDERGNRLADVRLEERYRIALALPSDRRLFVQSHSSEAEVRLKPGEALPLDRLAFHPIGTAARGAIDRALARGLFMSEFGPTYYRGIVDQNPEASRCRSIDRSPPTSPSPPVQR